jgi:hypothetical protein
MTKKIAMLALLLPLAACAPKKTAEPAKTGEVKNDVKTTTATHEPQVGRVDPTTVPATVMVRAAAGKDSKYTNPLASFYEPDDFKSYSDYSEYGWREAVTDMNSADFKKYGPTPAGWWVYVKPYWVVWNLKGGKTGP